MLFANVMIFVGSSAMVFAVCAIVFCFWGLICNQRTYNQKTKLCKAVFALSVEKYEPYYLMLDKVDYGQHIKAMIRFRDPLKLYNPKLIELMKKSL